MSNEINVARQFQQGIVDHGRLVELLLKAITCMEMGGLPLASTYFRRALAEVLLDSIQADGGDGGDDSTANDIRSATASS